MHDDQTLAPPVGMSRRALMLSSLATAALWPVGADLALAQDAPPAGPAPESAAAARDAVEAIRDQILRISREVWETPERHCCRTRR